ncbi:glycoside hydrolase family 13 protein [Algibacter mikhailovii]|uniref:glycoside hydrolase family 13 protein n=1 Tax=Algibacter mikhailovii TaxID=425498 RepID=UPI0024940B4A|nr:glycoside hydrolase family 13 protein [Algibacter mikhailovii]
MKAVFIIPILSLCLLLSCKEQVAETVTAQEESVGVDFKDDIERIEPMHWWIGFKNTELQLLVKHPNISQAEPEVAYQGVSIEKVHNADSPNYLFIDLIISEKTKPGKLNITFKFKNGDLLEQTYELRARKKQAEDFVGFDSSDAIYLITPDRFANANTSNDINTRLKEKTIDRTDDYARHGGDIEGIIKHLDYIQDMGFTAIWSCPLLTNNMPKSSYHGYAITDYYEIDPRYGDMNDYLELAEEAKKHGIKLVMDQVVNHCGSEHWWITDLPFKDWLNYQENFENKGTLITSNHRRTTNQDRYASKSDKKGMSDGWFVSTMPDLNQRNPFMAKYLIQNSIWWIETAELGGIRQDTYPYPDKTFMSNWAGAIMEEYPNFSIVGEEWSYNPLLIGYWQDGANNKDGYDSNLKSPMDFAMQRLIVEALNEEEKWDTGLVKMYEGLANDFHYASPKDVMIFPDNHDMSRIFTQLNGDINNTKAALSYMLVLPRITQIYYGTELLMNDFEKPGDHGLVRTDFPGGWAEDAINGFTGEGLSEAQKDMQSYLKIILNYRKESKAIHQGETVHFAPQDGVYVLFRQVQDETVIHIINKNEKPVRIDLTRFDEVGLNAKKVKNIITGAEFIWGNTLKLDTKGSLVLTTKLN